MELVDLVGKKVLVGVTYLKSDDRVRKHIQVHGTVVDDQGWPALNIDKRKRLYRLPPYYDAFEKVEKSAVFELLGTGEKVTGVEFTAVFFAKLAS